MKKLALSILSTLFLGCLFLAIAIIFVGVCLRDFLNWLLPKTPSFVVINHDKKGEPA